jgi:hypothetical protein
MSSLVNPSAHARVVSNQNGGSQEANSGVTALVAVQFRLGVNQRPARSPPVRSGAKRIPPHPSICTGTDVIAQIAEGEHQAKDYRPTLSYRLTTIRGPSKVHRIDGAF